VDGLSGDWRIYEKKGWVWMQQHYNEPLTEDVILEALHRFVGIAEPRFISGSSFFVTDYIDLTKPNRRVLRSPDFRPVVPVSVPNETMTMVSGGHTLPIRAFEGVPPGCFVLEGKALGLPA
jgi:hypothetical protein